MSAESKRFDAQKHLDRLARQQSAIDRNSRMKDAIIASLVNGNQVNVTLHTLGVSNTNYGKWRQTDPDFRARVEQARSQAMVVGDTSAYTGGFADFRKIFLGMDTFPHQARLVQVLDTVKPREIVLVNMHPEAGKDLSVTTPIPTPAGFTKIGDLAVGDEVYARDGSATRVSFVSPVLYRDNYEVTFSDRSTVVAGDEHLWVVRDRADRRQGMRAPEKVMSTVELIERGVIASGRPRFGVPVPAALDGGPRDLRIDPYLLGVWLGDGAKDCARISSEDPEIFDAFYARGYGKGAVDRCTRNMLGLYRDLRFLGVLGAKHIPRQYLRGRASDRWALLQGLMDTDGSCDRRGRCEFTTVTPALRDGMTELLASLGVKFSMVAGRSTLNGRDCGPKWRIQFVPRRPVFRLQRKLERQLVDIPNDRDRWRTITSIEPVDTVPSVCIKVEHPSETFVFGEQMLVTHNTTTIVDWITQKLSIEPDHRITYVSRSVGLGRKVVGQLQRRLSEPREYAALIAKFGPFYVEKMERQGKKWSQDAFKVWKADSDERDYSFEVRGWDSAAYGSRIDTLIVDDVQSQETLAQTEKILHSLRHTYFTRGRRMRIVIVGTRVGPGDVYERLVDADIIDHHIMLPAASAEGIPKVPGWWCEDDEREALTLDQQVDLATDRLKVIRKQVGEVAWWSEYMQRPNADVLATFTEDTLDQIQDKARVVGQSTGSHLPTAAGLDPALGGVNALTVGALGGETLEVIDCIADHHLARTEEILERVRDVAIAYRITLLVVENNAFQRAFARDERLRELGKQYGFTIIEHATHKNKADPIFGVASMAGAMMRNEITFPAGDQRSKEIMAPFISELRNWRPDLPAKILLQDRVMSLWFLWRHWAQTVANNGAKSKSNWNRRGVLWTPMSLGEPLKLR